MLIGNTLIKNQSCTPHSLLCHEQHHTRDRPSVKRSEREHNNTFTPTTITRQQMEQNRSKPNGVRRMNTTTQTGTHSNTTWELPPENTIA